MGCPACGSPGAEVFFRAPPVPVLSNELLRTREAALAVPRGAIALAHCPTCELIEVEAELSRLQVRATVLIA